jgi:hypothetical protein
MVTYHYVKFYVSIIIQLEVIIINVRNFKFPIGFYSNCPISTIYYIECMKIEDTNRVIKGQTTAK